MSRGLGFLWNTVLARIPRVRCPRGRWLWLAGLWLFPTGAWGQEPSPPAFAPPAFAPPTFAPPFAKAYLREKQELEQSLAILQKTLHDLQSDGQTRKIGLEGSIQKLLRRLSRLRRQGQEDDDAIKSLQTKQTQGRDSNALQDGLLRMGQQRLRQEAPSIRLTQAGSSRLVELFEASSRILHERSRSQTKEGRFFDHEGTEQKGEITTWGGIAAWGRWGSQVGLLEKQEGRYHALAAAPDDRAAIQAFFAGKDVSLLPLFLLDPLKKALPPAKPRGLQATLDAGGPIAWVLLCLALLGGLLLLERSVTLFRLRAGRNARWEGLLSLLRSSPSALREAHFQGMGLSTPLLLAIWHQRGSSLEAMEDAASQALLLQKPPLERSVALLGVLVTAAPLLGLLGTVTGMIATFEVITVHGTGNPALLSQGISEALITTEIGLAVAIPLLLAKSFFLRWADRLLETAQLRSLLLIQALEETASTSASEFPESSERGSTEGKESR